jgi:cytochrome c oxidase subunit 3
MVRAVQEGHRENQSGVVFWMLLTVLGGAAFLGCQAYEWTTLIAKENMTITVNPFGRHMDDGVYVKPDGTTEEFTEGTNYLLHKHDGAFDVPDVKYVTGVNDKGEKQYGETQKAAFGPKAFGALFFFITGFHGFHVFSGVAFLTIIMINAAGGLYASRKNGYEMVEKIGLYWHFVDLVWVFVFLVFYLL